MRQISKTPSTRTSRKKWILDQVIAQSQKTHTRRATDAELTDEWNVSDFGSDEQLVVDDEST